MASFANIILPLPLRQTFTYALPPSLQAQVRRGMRVVVPLGQKRRYIGVVESLSDVAPQGMQLRNVEEVLDSEPTVTDEQLRLWHWIAEYYMAAIGDVFFAAMPSGLKQIGGYKQKTEVCLRLREAYRDEQSQHIALDMLGRAKAQQQTFSEFLYLSDYGHHDITRDELLNAAHCTTTTIRNLVDRGFLETFDRPVSRLSSILKGGGESNMSSEEIGAGSGDTLANEPNKQGISHSSLLTSHSSLKELSASQQTAYDEIKSAFAQKSVCLLHGVTSSGKTEIYIHLIREQLEAGRQVLYLLPEIALTVQMMQRLKTVFGDRLGIYHSKYSDAERVEIWQKQLSDHPYDIILGARSAVFLPFQRLGLVVIDEEHETSYKQQDPAPRYHARSVAIVLAQMHKAKTLLGTATPSIETYHNAATGKYGLVRLATRFRGLELPEVTVVDTKEQQRRKLMRGAFSPLLLAKMREALSAGEQVILFQNRRGYARMTECYECGWVPHCTDCDVPLTYHRSQSSLSCHYCGRTYSIPSKCPNCGSTDLRRRGDGTEKIEDRVLEIFPDARVARMDLDTTRTRSAYERIIADFASGRTNVLIGTQMVTKGLDFDRVSVVGILSADTMLSQPDFRAHEHAYQMMQQVAGRAGRKGKRGLVILQTRQPELPIIGQSASGDFAALYKTQIGERQDFCYPPFCRLIYVYLRHRDERIADTAALEMSSRLRQSLADRVLGPDRPPVARVKDQHIRWIMLKIPTDAPLADVRTLLFRTEAQLRQDRRYNSLTIYYDVDPA